MIKDGEQAVGFRGLPWSWRNQRTILKSQNQPPIIQTNAIRLTVFLTGRLYIHSFIPCKSAGSAGSEGHGRAGVYQRYGP